MQFTPDLSRGSWVTGRFELSATVAGTVGSGFEAYARILHPVSVRRFDLNPSHRNRPGGRDIVERSRWRWSEVARRNGRTMHPLVQWRRLTDDESRTTFDDGWDLEQLREGFIDPEVLAELSRHLTDATSTPDDLTVGIWEGWGELGTNSVVYTASGRPDTDAQVAYAAGMDDAVAPEVRAVMDQLHAPPSRLFHREGQRQDPPLLELPGRRYLLLTTSTVELADPTWPLRAGIGWSESGPGVMPQLVWPRDGTWSVATEIDFDFTLVGGTRQAIDGILRSDSLEAFEVEADDDVSWDGDLVNEKREPAPDTGNPISATPSWRRRTCGSRREGVVHRETP
ncbi:MAG: hypothetical protein JWP75_3851 [Frondihabitans sp.]|nr:hypothetical protein [Frondihabitans sp.]